MIIQIPEPETLLQLTWFIIGILFSRAFGKQIDQQIQNSEWFKAQRGPIQELVRRICDFLHHFWVGLLLIVYAPQIAAKLVIDPEMVYWFGAGLVVDDIPDMPRRFLKYFSKLPENPLAEEE